MENEFEQGDGVVIKKGTHSLEVGSNGVFISQKTVGEVGGLYTEYTIAGRSAIHPERIILNQLLWTEFEAL